MNARFVGIFSAGQHTGPSSCQLIDWEDWGMAPRGLDAATLWVDALAVPALATRV